MRLDDGLDVTRAMVIYAHPDDAEFGAAGTVARWTGEGVEVVYLLVTNGASGSSDPNMTREKLVDIRLQEQRDAANVLGVKEVIPLGFEDGYLYPTLELRKAVSREIRKFQPDVIITPHDPAMRTWQTFYINHPDHIAVGEVVFRAINPDASSGLMFPELWQDEGLQPFLPHALFVSNFEKGSTYVDITDTIDRKIEALLCHRSQIEKPGDIEPFVRERAKAIGQRAGYAWAEGFEVFRFDGGPVPREASGE